MSSRSSPRGTQRHGRCHHTRSRYRLSQRGQRELSKHRQCLVIPGTSRRALAHGSCWTPLAAQDSQEETLPRAPHAPLHCRRGRSCARGDPRPGRQGLSRNRSRPVGGGGKSIILPTPPSITQPTNTWEAHLPTSCHQGWSEAGSSGHRSASLRVLPGGRTCGGPFRRDGGTALSLLPHMSSHTKGRRVCKTEGKG